MKPLLFTLLFFLGLLLPKAAIAQTDSIFDQGVWRSYIVHLPTGYTPSRQYPLVVNLHGLNSSAASQQAYSQFDNVADTAEFIVAYPNAIGGSWVINGSSDADFISHLVDTLRQAFSCSNCLFVTGMSQGAFLSYKLVCSMPQPITALAAVSGNMSQNLQNNCGISSQLPIMHFHGTADSLVKYNGAFGIPPVENTVQWWVSQNNCNPTPTFSALPNSNIGDSSTVERYAYTGAANGSEVTFFKVINGGHTWPGGMPVPPFGFTNMDIQASALIGSFFKGHCSAPLANDPGLPAIGLGLFPNPASNLLHVTLPGQVFDLEIVDAIGRQVHTGKAHRHTTELDCSDLPAGVYTVHAISTDGSTVAKLIVQH